MPPDDRLGSRRCASLHNLLTGLMFNDTDLVTSEAVLRPMRLHRTPMQMHR